MIFVFVLKFAAMFENYFPLKRQSFPKSGVLVGIEVSKLLPNVWTGLVENTLEATLGFPNKPMEGNS